MSYTVALLIKLWTGGSFGSASDRCAGGHGFKPWPEQHLGLYIIEEKVLLL